MPTYRYRCDTCGNELEVWQSFQEAPLTVHAADGGRLRRVLSAAGIVLKGPGFYRNDSRSGGNGKRSDSEPSKSKESTDSKEPAGSKDAKGSKDRTPASGDSKPASTSTSSSSSGD